MASRIETCLVGKPYERFYRVSMRIIQPDDPSAGVDSVSWRKDRAEAEKIFKGAAPFDLMAKAIVEFGWDDAKKMTVEKKLTMHVFNAQGREIPRSEICLMKESAIWEDLEALIIENARKNPTRKGEF